MAVLRVAGVTFGGRQELLRRVYDEFWTEGRENEITLELHAEVGNPHDENAVRVVVMTPEAEVCGSIGYVPREAAAKVRDAIRQHHLGKVKFEDMKVGGSNVVSATIRLLKA